MFEVSKSWRSFIGLKSDIANQGDIVILLVSLGMNNGDVSLVQPTVLPVWYFPKAVGVGEKNESIAEPTRRPGISAEWSLSLLALDPPSFK